MGSGRERAAPRVPRHPPHVQRLPQLAAALLLVVVALMLNDATGGANAGAGTVTVEVVDEQTGDPLPATVLILDGGSSLATLAPGDAPAVVPAGDWKIVATYEQYGNEVSERLVGWNPQYGEVEDVVVVDGQNTHLRIEMTPPATVRFRALSERDGTVVTPLGVWTTPKNTASDWEATSLGDGWYEAVIHAAPIVSRASVDGPSVSRSHELPQVAGGDTVVVQDPLSVPVPPTFTARVVDPNGVPVAGATVEFLTNGFGVEPSHTAITDADGRFSVETLHTVMHVAAFPPPTRPDLAAGTHAGAGLNGAGWPIDQRHVDTEIVLPFGSWNPVGQVRTRPTVARPVTGVLSFAPASAGINVVHTTDPAPAGTTALGRRIELWNVSDLALIDVHTSLAPLGTTPTLVPLGGQLLACDGQVGCEVHRSVGPEGHQFAISPSWHISSWVLVDAALPDVLYLDPPITFTRSFSTYSADITIGRADGCVGDVAVTGDNWLVTSAPSSAPGTLGLSIGSTRGEVRVQVGDAVGVVVHQSLNAFPDIAASVVPAFGGAAPTDCPVPTTTTTAPPTTTTTAVPTTTTTVPTTTTTTTTPAPTTPTTTTVPSTPGTSSTTAVVSTTQPPEENPRPFGYALATSAGQVIAFGGVDDRGELTSADVAAIVLHPTDGYWLVEFDGTVHAFGEARHLGDAAAGFLRPDEQVTTMAARPDGDGYWLITDLGRVAAFGTAQHHGDLSAFTLDGPVIDAAATPSGNGYYLVASDGGLFTFGDAEFRGSVPQVLPGVTLDSPVVGLASDPDGQGYWFVAGDGGVFGFDAPFRGSIPGVLPAGTQLAAPINGMVPYGNGYLLVAGDGGVFTFSDLAFLGSLGDVTLDSPIVGIAAT